MRTRLLLGLVAGLLLVPLTGTAHAGAPPSADLPETWVDLHASLSSANDISDGGLVVGSAPYGDRQVVPVLLDLTTGVTAVLGAPRWLRARASGVNESGVVVGAADALPDPKDPPLHPFVWDPVSETRRDVGTLCVAAPCNGQLMDVNENDIAVGDSQVIPQGPRRAMRYDIDADEMTDLGTLGGDESRAAAIADDGTIVGWSNLVADGPPHAFLRDPVAGVLEDIGTLPGHTQSEATGINPSGTLVVGWSAPNANSDQTHAFVYEVSTETMTDIGTLGGPTSFAGDVNDAGIVAGRSDSAEGDVHGVFYDTTTSTLIDAATHGSAWFSGLTALNESSVAVGFAGFGLPVPNTRPAALTRWTFADVPPWHSFSDDIEWVAAEGIATGWPDDTYRPAADVTRQAMAAFLYRLAGSPAFTPPATPTFTDVATTHSFYAEIEWLAAEGIALGFPDNSFRPAIDVTRQAQAAYLYRLAGAPGFTPPATPTFSDVPLTHTFYAEIEWMSAEGVSTGFSDGTYRPAVDVTRQAMAAFLHRFADGPGVGI